MMSKSQVAVVSVVLVFCLMEGIDAFQQPLASAGSASRNAFVSRRLAKASSTSFLRMSADQEAPSTPTASAESAVDDDDVDPMEEAMMDDETARAMAKAKRAAELRAQEVFMKKSTGIHKCGNCDWEFDEAKGDVMMIGGQIQPGTKFEELPSNWRCPVCRASKDSFVEIVEEIPGFEVNQGYGFGTNAWTAQQKNFAIFGGLGLFFILFLSGYALS